MRSPKWKSEAKKRDFVGCMRLLLVYPKMGGKAMVNGLRGLLYTQPDCSF